MNPSLSSNYIKISRSISNNYNQLKDKLNTVEIYPELEFKKILSNTDLDCYKGKAKHRTLIKNDIRLYKSIITYTDQFKKENNLQDIKTHWVERLLICQNNFILDSYMVCQCGKSSAFDKQTQKFSKKFCPKCRISSCSKEWFKFTYGDEWELKYKEYHTDEYRLKRRKQVGRKSWFIRKGQKFNGCLCRGKNETKILDFIEKKHNTILERGKHINGYYVDGYCPINNIVYEVYEHYHKYQKQYDDIRRIDIMNFLNCKFVILYDNNDHNLEEITIKRYDKI